MTPDGEETSALLRRLPGVRAFVLELAAATMVTPSMRRLRFTAEGLADLEAFPGQDLMVAVPAAGQAHFRRRYTIRRLVRDDPAVEMDIVLHGDGPGAAWARDAREGDRVEAIGPRGKIPLSPDATSHLFFGDESSMPAIFTMVEALPSGARASVVLEVAGAEDHQTPREVRADLELRWVHRLGDPGTGTGLQDAVAGLGLADHAPGDLTTHAYVFGELRQVAACRTALLELGFSPEQVDHKAYWRRGVANAAHGEPER